MLIQDDKATARDAADIFADAYSDEGEEPRVVGKVISVGGYGDANGGIDFQFVHGTRWYSVRMKFDYSGWLITQSLSR